MQPSKAVLREELTRLVAEYRGEITAMRRERQLSASTAGPDGTFPCATWPNSAPLARAAEAACEYNDD